CGAGAAAGAAAPPGGSSLISADPSATLSPSLTSSSFTIPACDDGISIDALSLSTVMSDCSCFTASPGLTSNSMTSTSLKSPMSGTFTSTSAMLSSPRFFSGVQRVDLVGVEAVLADRVGDLGRRHRAIFGERLQRGHHDVVAVDLEVLAQLAAEVAAAEAVGAQHAVAASLGDEGADLVGVAFHVVGGRDHRPGMRLQLLRDEGHARLLGRVQQVPA